MGDKLSSKKKTLDRFEWNGTISTVFGIKMIQAPSFTLPKVRYKTVKIPGRSGSMTIMEDDHTEIEVVVPNIIDTSDDDNGGHSSTKPQEDDPTPIPTYRPIVKNDIKHAYDNVIMSCTCLIKGTDMIREIASWLRGYGTVRFANYWDVYYQARIANQITFQKLSRGNDYYTFTVTFDCEPTFLFYLNTDTINPDTPGYWDDDEDDDDD